MDLIESMKSSTIRGDKNTQTGSVLDLIKMVLACDSSSTNTTFRRLLQDNTELGTSSPGGCPQHLRINRKGKKTPVADAKTLIEIVWLLPRKKEHAFRRQSS